MRIYSQYPKYSDAKNPVALWRGTLLMSHSPDLSANIYRNYSQPNNFKACGDPIGAINAYFTEVHKEALGHGYYEFDRGELGVSRPNIKIKVGNGRMDHEIKHLAEKLKLRDPDYSHFKNMIKIKPYSFTRGINL